MAGFQVIFSGRFWVITEVDPANLGPQMNIAYIFYEAQDYETALSEFIRLRQAHPSDVHALYGHALCLHKMERFGEALPLWREFLQRAPSDSFTPTARKMAAEAQTGASVGK